MCPLSMHQFLEISICVMFKHFNVRYSIQISNIKHMKVMVTACYADGSNTPKDRYSNGLLNSEGPLSWRFDSPKMK